MGARRYVLALCAVLVCVSAPAHAGRSMAWTDLMKMRKVHSVVLSDDGRWLAFEARPGRGDGEVIVRATKGRDEHRIERGQSPLLSADGRWAAAESIATFEKREKEKDDAPDPGAVLLRTEDGERWEFERVKSFAFSDDGGWFAVHFEADEPDTSETDTDAEADASSDEDDDRTTGTRAAVIRLTDQARVDLADVTALAFDPTSRWIAVAHATAEGADNRLALRALADGLPEAVVHVERFALYPAITWAPEHAKLAYLRGIEDDEGEVEDIALDLVAPSATGDVGSVRTVASSAGSRFPAENELEFTRDGQRLFVGQRPADATTEDEEQVDPESEEESPFDPFDLEAIRSGREVDVWHWNDPRIKTNERATHEDRQKHLYRAVVDVASARLVPLADQTLTDVDVSQNPGVAHGHTAQPHLELMTWDGFYEDHYVVDLATGVRTLVVEKTQDTVAMSPGGRFVVFYRPDDGGQWWCYDVATTSARPLGAELDVPFANEDHDYPRTAPGYGIGGWATDDSAVLIYDKYDVWRFSTQVGPAVCLTEGRGRNEQRVYRVLDLDDEKEGFDPEESLLLTGYDDRAKNSSIWRGSMASAGIERLREDDKRYAGFRRAKSADVVVYTEERYDEFPDFWATNGNFRSPKKVTKVNPQLDELDLGEAELIEWTSVDGVPLQGVLIKPAGYDPDRRYPVLLYFYRFFSQRLHQFNDPQINHRPSFPIYAGDGYAVFLPDVRFDIGNPGYAATKCLVPGVQKIIDMGVADPDGIALHGHSWSGYQAAHVITQTNIFACAVAGAPVSNMTSAYGGVRWGTGLSRQFQYEKSQSRIGASLWERRDLYVENSPLFFADRIETPLLIQFGDEDEAVPWTQGIELYMAMRRLHKPAVMLQYRGEPHHLKKYPNKVDYSIKMKEFVDHFAKGAPAPGWWVEGVAFEGED